MLPFTSARASRFLMLVGFVWCCGGLAAQEAMSYAANVVLPQSRVMNAGHPISRASVTIESVNARIEIMEQAATTVLQIELANPSPTQQEAELLVPVPDDAVIKGFDFQGAGKEPSARLLPAGEARATYDAIVAKLRDPALLEFAGGQLVRSSVFPVPAGGKQTVRLTYEHLLPASGNRLDLCLPRSESLDYRVPWNIRVHIRSKTPVATVYSPSHALTTTRASDHDLTVNTTGTEATRPGSFLLSVLRQQDAVTATFFACPDETGTGGYFLLLAGIPPASKDAPAQEVIKREVTLVLDCSGSMDGEKFEQAKTAARQVLGSLRPGERFNLIPYSDTINTFAAQPVEVTDESVQKARSYLSGLRSGGGTNIHGALNEALQQPTTEGTLPVVLFLTDGLPTVGQCGEKEIRDLAAKANPHQRRIFSFGVGFDVNTPLLEALADDSRGSPTFVLPKEDVEVKVGAVFRKLNGPVLADPALKLNSDSSTTILNVMDVLPARLPDLFDNDQLVVLGRYSYNIPFMHSKSPSELEFELTGRSGTRQRTFRFAFSPQTATTRNAFVSRLWASRRIGALVDEVRRMDTAGSAPSPAALASSARSHHAVSSMSMVSPAASTAPANPRLKELTDEILRLSLEFGILTEYTSFLANEGTDLRKQEELNRQAASNLQNRAIATRSGRGSMNQSLNNVAQRAQTTLNNDNAYFDDNMNRVTITTVQQLNDRAFFRRGNRWIDSRLLQAPGNVPATEQPTTPSLAESETLVPLIPGLPAYTELASKLIAQHRQGALALEGEVLLQVEGKPVLLRNGN